jgi:hypothetical protein
MLGYIVISVVIVLVAAAAVAIIARSQAKRLSDKFRLQITNRGNVRSRYELRAEDSNDALAFRFTLDGDPLPQRELSGAGEERAAEPAPPAPSGQTAGEGGVRPKVDKAVGLGGAIASGLNTLGMILPQSIRTPVVRLSSRIQSGQMKVVRARQVSDQASRVKSKTKSKTKTRTTGRRRVEPVPGSVETPSVRPDETMAVALVVRAIRASEVRTYPFSIHSRSIELEDAPWVVEESSARILAATGLFRYFPYLIVFAVTAALLILVVWLASSGGLG